MLTYTVPFGFTVFLHFTKCIETLNRHLKQVLTIEVYVFESEKCMETFAWTFVAWFTERSSNSVISSLTKVNLLIRTKSRTTVGLGSYKSPPGSESVRFGTKQTETLSKAHGQGFCRWCGETTAQGTAEELCVVLATLCSLSSSLSVALM